MTSSGLTGQPWMSMAGTSAFPGILGWTHALRTKNVQHRIRSFEDVLPRVAVDQTRPFVRCDSLTARTRVLGFMAISRSLFFADLAPGFRGQFSNFPE